MEGLGFYRGMGVLYTAPFLYGEGWGALDTVPPVFYDLRMNVFNSSMGGGRGGGGV